MMPRSHSKITRNRGIVQQYDSGKSYGALADMHGVSVSRICRIVHRYGGPPTKERLALNALQGRSAGGRPAVWPDCPEHLRERYEKAKKRIGAIAARRKIEAQEKLRVEIALCRDLAA